MSLDDDLLAAGDDLARTAELLCDDARWLAKYRLSRDERTKTKALAVEVEAARTRWIERRRMSR